MKTDDPGLREHCAKIEQQLQEAITVVTTLARCSGRICMRRGNMWARAPMLRGSSCTHTTSRSSG